MGSNGFSTKIHALLPGIRERREEIEQGRRLPQDLVDDLSATGIFRLAIPQTLGGLAADPLDVMRAIELVSTADGSTGWCAMLGIGAGYEIGHLAEGGAREVYARMDAPKALVAEPAGAAVDDGDGVRVSGRWRFASGITHSDWVLAGCIMMDGGQPRMTEHGPEIVHVFMPVSDVQVHDTWHVSGLCGTGSNDFSCENVFVPRERVTSLFNPMHVYPEPQYRMPVLSLVAPMISAVAVGIARAALDELYELAGTKTPSMSMVPMSEKAAAHVILAQAEGELGAARSYLYDTLDDIWQTVVGEGTPSLRQEALCRIASNQATATAARVARTASTFAGSTSVYTSSSLQRHVRDADVITHHFTQSPYVWEDAGRVLLGQEPLAPLF